VTDIAVFEDLADRFQELYGRGEHRQALDLLTRESTRFPDYEVIAVWFQVRVMALTGDTVGALRLFEEAVSKGHWYHEDALHNTPDLARLQGVPEFEELVARCKARRLQAMAEAKPSLTVLQPQNQPHPWPLLLPLRAANPEFVEYWKAAADEGWLVAIPQSSQVGWHRGLYVWDDLKRTIAEIQQHCARLGEQYELDRDRAVIAGFSRHSQIALQVALSSEINLCGVIAVEAWLPDMSIWPPIVKTSENSTLRGYFVAGRENVKFYDPAEEMVGLLESHGIECKLEGTSNKRHRFPPEFEEVLRRALSFIVNDE
jgi:predicted esterase